VAGIETNRAYLAPGAGLPDFVAGKQTTRMLESFHYRPGTVDVLEPGVQSSLQDWPGRTGYWDVGVPPSGPMDSLSMRLANRLAGNPEGAAALELTAAGPTLKFNCDTVIALGGAAMAAKLDGAAIDHWRRLSGEGRRVLKLGAVEGAGCALSGRAGGFQAPDYLGSKSTFTLGQFGGHGGPTLRAGDVLHLPSHPALPPRGEGLGERAVCRLVRRAIPPPHPCLGNRRALRPPRRAGFLHRPRTSTPSSPPTGRCTTTPAAPACA
jgi:urea carboxylase